MMRSLWAGVSGLQAHQIAMDVEGNNIANVNTFGYKYSRADFSTIMSQTSKIATAPDGDLGGKNPLQVGLGATISSTTRIFSQGNIQMTEKNTDLAINGDGFFVVSNDGGTTRMYTRSGDFKTDAAGNFVDNNGYTVQGWNYNQTTGQIDSSVSPNGIVIPPGMSMPAKPSSEVALKANLNSGLELGKGATSKRPIYALDSTHGYREGLGPVNENDPGNTEFYTTSKTGAQVTEKGVDAAVLFNAKGESLNLRDGQGMWVSFKEAQFKSQTAFNPDLPTKMQDQETIGQNGAQGPITGPFTFWGAENGHGKINAHLDVTINGTHIEYDGIGKDQFIDVINSHTKDTGVVASIENGKFVFTNDNSTGSQDNTKNLNISFGGNNTVGRNVQSYQVAAPGVAPGQPGDVAGVMTITFAAAPGGQPGQADANNANGQPAINGDPLALLTGATDIAQMQPAPPPGAVMITNPNLSVITAHKYAYTPNSVEVPNDDPQGNGQLVLPTSNGQNGLINGEVRNFNTTEDLRQLLQMDARYGVDYDTLNGGGFDLPGAAVNNAPAGRPGDINPGVTVTVGNDGRFKLTNPEGVTNVTATPQPGGNPAVQTTNPHDMNMQISTMTNEGANISANEKFTDIFTAWDGNFNAGTDVKLSQDVYLAAHSSTIEIYDSLGSKHAITIQFTKQDKTRDGGAEWSTIISVPEPAEINFSGNGAPGNIVVGKIRFNNDGSLQSYTPTSLNFSGNNGSKPNQQVKLDLGTTGDFNGVVSYDKNSATIAQSTDGYTGGNLKPDALRADENGFIYGEFTNGRTLALARVAMASFPNNMGLEEIGGNLFKATANSGDPTVGLAGEAGRGGIKSSAIEMSNVDLSRSLTQLIVIQRGYQANSKTISTSDQMLNTLLQLKQ